jgi:hypothetical protein
MAPTCSPPLLGLLRNLFDEVMVSVLLSGFSSPHFSPCTGVLQGSVLSPALYSLYINLLPSILRLADQALNFSLHHLPPPLIPNTVLNSLLYADDIVLIGSRDSLPTLLQVAERASHDLGFRWSATKCVILAPPQTPPEFIPYMILLSPTYPLLGTLVSPFPAMAPSTSPKWSPTTDKPVLLPFSLSFHWGSTPMVSPPRSLSPYTNNLSAQLWNTASPSPNPTNVTSSDYNKPNIKPCAVCSVAIPDQKLLLFNT